MTGIRQMKATWFSVTAYDKNIDKLTSKDGCPAGVKCIYGGIEECPTTGRKHFQGAIQCNGQQRASIILDWLPGVHIEKAESAVALKKYCMKEETAVGEKSEWKNPDEYLTMDKALDKLARYVPDEKDSPKDYNGVQVYDPNSKKLLEWQYWEGVKKIIVESPSQIGLYSQPQIYRAWQHTRSVWIERAKSIVLQPAIEGSMCAEEPGVENLCE